MAEYKAWLGPMPGIKLDLDFSTKCGIIMMAGQGRTHTDCPDCHFNVDNQAGIIKMKNKIFMTLEMTSFSPQFSYRWNVIYFIDL